MSLYTFATDNLTTSADRRRRPALDHGQVARTLALLVVVAVAMAAAAHRGNAADMGRDAVAAITASH